MLSILCPSLNEPSVVIVRTCVSPLVNSPEPWVRGNRPTCDSMGRISFRPRPSGLIPRSNIRFLTSTLTRSSKATATLSAGYSDDSRSITRAFTLATPASRAALSPGLNRTSSSLPSMADLTALSSSPGKPSGVRTWNLGLPIAWVISSIRSTTSTLIIWAIFMAWIRISSDTPLAPASTITTPSRVPPTTRSNVLSSSCWNVGLPTSLPST